MTIVTAVQVTEHDTTLYEVDISAPVDKCNNSFWDVEDSNIPMMRIMESLMWLPYGKHVPFIEDRPSNRVLLPEDFRCHAPGSGDTVIGRILTASVYYRKGEEVVIRLVVCALEGLPVKVGDRIGFRMLLTLGENNEMGIAEIICAVHLPANQTTK